MDARELTSELNLKTMVSLQGLVQDEQRGLITKAQVATGIRAIFDAVGGLISQDTFDVLSAAVQHYKGHRGIEANFIKSPNNTIRGYVRVCGPGSVLRIDQAVPVRLPEYSEDTDEQAIKFANALFTRMRDERQW